MELCIRHYSWKVHGIVSNICHGPIFGCVCGYDIDSLVNRGAQTKLNKHMDSKNFALKARMESHINLT
jgi:hypothetical protein